VGALGSYSLVVTSGTMAAGLGAAAPIISFRWGSASNVCLVRRVFLSMNSLGTGFTAGVALLNMFAARAFSGSDTGGTTATISGNNAKKRTSFGTTALTELRYSQTATLTAGTRTKDAQPLASLQWGVPVTTNFILLPTTNVWFPDPSSQWPLVLAQNEGFVLEITVPATGTWQYQCGVDWDEVASY
jgi:hypothetical protein